MEMRTTGNIDMGEDITPPLLPLAFSLYDSFLFSHCSSCFLPLSPSSSSSSPLPPATAASVSYCSPNCSSSDSPLHFSSAEHHLFLLLRSSPSLFPHGDTSDLRAALRLLGMLPSSSPPLTSLPRRLFGLLTNIEKLRPSDDGEEDGTLARRMRDGVRVMAMARAMRDGEEFDAGGDCAAEAEEAVLCLVITNAVEVKVMGGGVRLGIAVYDRCFSWINHSCSPNCCYRFNLSSDVSVSSFGEAGFRIAPCGEEAEIEENGGGSFSRSAKGLLNYGPRLTLRSIKSIGRGEEVTVTYTELLRPTEVRQSELWSNYGFFCRCRRCAGSPQSSVDQCLEETFPRFGTEKLKYHLEDIITEYMLDGDAAWCCGKIESMLMRGVVDELEERKSVCGVGMKLSPLHHLSLDGYTALQSAYRVGASSDPEPQAFGSWRTSTGYSLLLAGATHHLFLLEPSVIASASTFWTGAGESLIRLGRRCFQHLPERDVPLVAYGVRCGNCLLLEEFEANFGSTEAREVRFEEASRQFLNCISSMVPLVWPWLVRGCRYLEGIGDPINFSWHEALKTGRVQVDEEEDQNCDTDYGRQGLASEVRRGMFELGVHCVLYGGYLSYICYGLHPYTSCYMRNLLHG